MKTNHIETRQVVEVQKTTCDRCGLETKESHFNPGADFLIDLPNGKYIVLDLCLDCCRWLMGQCAIDTLTRIQGIDESEDVEE